ncbi:hypothetical protein L1887_20694 [Cichorium endivia]|nr:hypothetical protein L1887_20694 [Cichorium endivia]
MTTTNDKYATDPHRQVFLTRRTGSYHSYSQSRPYDCIDEDPLVVQQKAILIALMKEPWKLSQLLKMKKKLANHSLSIEFFVGKPLKQLYTKKLSRLSVLFLTDIMFAYLHMAKRDLGKLGQWRFEGL